MIPLPTRRWLVGALLFGGLWPLWASMPDGGGLVLLIDLAWIALFALDWWLVPDPSAITLERIAPVAFSVGRPAVVRYRWTNASGRAVPISVREALPGPFVEGPAAHRGLWIPAGWTVNEDITLHPRRRGRAEGGRLWIRMRGPLGLAEVQTTRDAAWTAIVFPDLTEAALRALPTRQARRREAGMRNVRRLGEGRVFETLKEWVPGDDTRSIDWKATAKRGKTMARQYEDERRQQVLIILDAGRMLTAEVEGRARFESAVDAALQLAYSAAEHDDDIGLLVFADTIQHYLPPRRGRRALRAVVEALATAEGRLVEPDYPAAFAFLAERNRKRALTVFFTDVIDRTASDALLAQVATLRPRHLPLAVTLRDPGLERTAVAHAVNADQAFDRAAAEELLTARAEALAGMRGRGALVLDVAPAHAARAVVEQYERLKRRGLL